jgi:protein O-mannosyl-transferase
MYRRRPPPQPPINWGRLVQRWGAPVVCILLAVITFMVFWQTKGFDFVNFDDGFYVYHNTTVAGGLSLKGLGWVFTHADGNLYHPLTMLSLMADYQLHKLDAGGYHVTNVLLHAASVILLFLILRQMTGALWRSAFVAAVFAIHPLRAESVAWVSERKDVLSTFFFMLTLGAYVRYARNLKSQISNLKFYYAATLFFFALGLLSKPTVVTLPFVLLLLDYWPLNRFEQNQKPSRLILEKVPLLVLAAGACVMTVLAAGKEVAAYTQVSMLSRLGNALVSYVVYLRQMVWPGGLAVFYPRPENGYPVWTVALSFLVLALITGGVVAFGRKRRWLLTGWLWYLGMLTPMIGIVQAGAFAHADRFTYLPQIGIYVALAWLVAEWRMNRVALGSLMAGVIIALMVCAWKQAAVWRDSETLWTHALACITGNYMANYNLGDDYLEEGKLDEAITNYQATLQIKPDHAEARNNLGNIFFQQGRTDEAISQYQQALQIKPGFELAHYNLAVALLQKGRLDEAIVQFQDVLQSNPGNVDAQYNLAAALFKEGKIDEANIHYQKVRQIRPDYAEGLFNLGNDLREKGNLNEAIAQYEDALRINPDYAPAQINLGSALLQTGKVDEAISHLQRALELDPNYAQAHNNLGNAFEQKGNMSEAIAHYQQAMQMEPNDPWIKNNLAWLLATGAKPSLRDGNKAVELARQAGELVRGENPNILHTLAAAYAEAGQFSEAVETAQRALALAEAQSNSGLGGQLQSELKLYQAGSPFHSPGEMRN